MIKRTMLAIFGLLCVHSLAAKTVALWPLDYNPAIGTYDGRCAIDSANDLTVANVTATNTAAEAGWNLPANPDSTPKLFESAFPQVLYTEFGGTRKGFLRNENGPGKYLYMSKDFTLEGWIYLDSLPTDGNLYFIARYGTGSSAAKWLFTLRNKSGAWTGGVSWQINYNSTERLLAKVEGDELTALVKTWHHFALTHARSSGQSICKLYIDGVLKGTNGPIDYSPAATGSDNLEIGGRVDSANNINGAMKYVRLSDKALEPEEFLNYGGAGTPVPTARKTFFWPLGKTARGGVDGAPAVGQAYLSGSFTANTQNRYSLVAPSEDCAFTDNPPNANVLLPNGNAGSFLGTTKTSYSSLWVADLGKDVMPFNDFTVEGWAKIERHLVETADGNGHMIGTRDSSPGWLIQTTANLKTGATTIGALLSDGSIVVNTTFGDISDKVGEWHHYAVTYDADGGANGFGRWTCYVDGVLLGTIDNPRAVGTATAQPTNLKLFRLSGSNQAFNGKLDCWRVAKTILTPDQFMCAKDGSAATDVLALWPMNVINGAYFDGRDIVGSYHLEAAEGKDTTRDAYWQAKATDDTPPQPGLAPGSGSVGFGGYGGKRAFLYTSNVDVYNTLRSASGFTWEAWMKHTEESTSTEFVLYFVRNSGGITNIGNGDYKMIFMYKADGFVLNAPGFSDTAFGATLEKDKWTHVALVFDGSNYNWSLYLDGEKRGKTLVGNHLLADEIALYIGGRSNAENYGFRGMMSCMRMTEGALTADRFLCNQTVPAKGTLAYWPIESDGSDLDLESRLPTKWRLSASGAVTGSDDQAEAACSNPDASPDFIGDAKENVGSAELGTAAYTLKAGSLGEKLDLSAPFTVEGWVKWDNSLGACKETVIGAWNAAKNGGWRLLVDSTGATPTLRVQAKVPAPGTWIVNKTFGACPAAGEWAHVALTYEPTVLFGTWTLFLNGKKVGTAVNAFRATCEVDLGDWAKDLTIGAQSGDGTSGFAGLVDMWRVTSGILDRKELLNYYRKGLMILLKGGEK